MIRATKIVDGRVPLPARSGYISENRGTFLGKSRHGKVYPAVFRTRQGESGRRPISYAHFTLEINRYPAVSRFDQGIPCCDCCDVYPNMYYICIYIYIPSLYTQEALLDFFFRHNALLHSSFTLDSSTLVTHFSFSVLRTEVILSSFLFFFSVT